MIRRYLPSETVFNHNKYPLSPIKGEVAEEANGMFELEIDAMRDVVLNKGDILSVPTPRGEQPFRVYRIVKTLMGKKVFAKHIFYDLLNNFLIDVRPTNSSLNVALNHLLANTETPTSFTGSSDVVGSNTAYYIRKNPVEAIIGAENSLLNLWGGNLVRNGKDIQIKANGNDRGFEIRLGKNLIGIEDDSDESSIFTRLYPTVELNQVVYALPEKYVNSPQMNYYPEPIIKEVRVELTEEQRLLDMALIYDIMRTYCQNLYNIDNIDKPIANYKVDFVQLRKISGYEQYELLEQLDLYDLVTINVESLGINLKAKVISYKYDCLAERYSEIELGGFKSTAKYQTSNIIRQIQNDLVNQKGLIAGAIDYATNVITGNKGGYIKFNSYPDGKPYELLFLDTDNIQTAVEVIRINKSGVGFSHTGYNGPFETAIIAGQLVTGTGFFNSIITNLIASDIGSSLNLTSNTAITGLVEGKAEKSEVTQLATDLTIKFGTNGGRNLIKNGLFKNGVGDIALYYKTAGTEGIGVLNNEWTGNVPALTITNDTAGAETTYFKIISDLVVGKKYTIGCVGAGHRAKNSLVAVNFADSEIIAISNEVNNGLGGVNVNNWTLLKLTFTATESKIRLRFHSIANDANSIFWLNELRCFEGETLLPYEQHPDEAYGTSYKFDSTGFEMKDNNGGVLIEVSKGIANEQNFTSTQNVEDGYPLNMSFRIGETTSLIEKVEIRLKQYPFRTDSKGAASGGGSTSGPSSKTTADSWDGGGGVQTNAPYGGVANNSHTHFILASKLVHSHGMAHTHSTPSHTHGVIFGILEIANTNGTIEVDINGVRRTGTTNTDITLDITTWITTNGVHNISLRSPNLKRIQCDIYIKSYIRR